MTTWKQYNGGLRWSTLSTGQIRVEGQGVIRTKGRPLTMLYLVREWGEDIERAARIAGIPREWLAAMITVEAQRMRSRPLKRLWRQVRTRLLRVARRRGWRAVFEELSEMERRNGLRFDPVSLRLEPGYVSPLDTPGRISASLAQVLLSTAREMAEEMGLELLVVVGEKGERFSLRLDQALIFDPQLSLLVAARYMRWQMDRYSEGVEGCAFDFVHLTGAYNAGSVKPDHSKVGRNPFGLIAYHRWRTDKAVRSLNDCHDAEVMAAWPSTNGGV